MDTLNQIFQGNKKKVAKLANSIVDNEIAKQEIVLRENESKVEKLEDEDEDKEKN
jgi:hypothetical protein